MVDMLHAATAAAPPVVRGHILPHAAFHERAHDLRATEEQ